MPGSKPRALVVPLKNISLESADIILSIAGVERSLASKR